MSQQVQQLEGGALEAGAVEKQIIAEIIGGYEQWKSEQLALEGGKRRRRGGSLEGGEETLEGGGMMSRMRSRRYGGSEDFEGGEDQLEGGKKPCKSTRVLKLSCGKGTRRFKCTKMSSKSKSKSKRHSKKSKTSKRRKLSPWIKKVVACSKKKGITLSQAMKKLKNKKPCK